MTHDTALHSSGAKRPSIRCAFGRTKPNCLDISTTRHRAPPKCRWSADLFLPILPPLDRPVRRRL